MMLKPYLTYSSFTYLSHMVVLEWSLSQVCGALSAWLPSSFSSISYLQLLKISCEFISNIVSFPFVWFSFICLNIIQRTVGLVVFVLTYTESLSQFSIKHVETFDKDHVYVYSFLVIYSCWRDASWHKQTTSRGERININSSNSFRVKDMHFTCAKTITRSEKQNETPSLRLHRTILIFVSHSQHIRTHEPK